MVGRGAQGNPWIFKRIKHYFETGIILKEPSLKEKVNMMVRHMQMLIETKGEHTGVCEMRKHIAWYLKGLHNSAGIKEKVFRLDSPQEIIQLLEEYAMSL